MPITPRATYRLQIHAGFDLDRAAAVTDYLAELGVSHVYTSPLLQAVPGSSHGYDGIDPTRIDAERGGEEGYARFSDALARQPGLGHVLDIVPNHLATYTGRDPASGDLYDRWWWDLLRHGRRSPYARFFDVEWEPEPADADAVPGDREPLDLTGRVLVPVLGRSLAEAVEEGEIVLGRIDGEPVVRYFEHTFPLDTSRLGPEDRAAVDAASEGAGDPLPPDRLLAALERQRYRLAHWRRARGELNYRRFFDISDLAGVRQEDPEVFRATHERVLRMVESGRLDGLRVDHPDGLRDPREYLDRLASAAPGAWIVVEKILEPGEDLRGDWPVAGTTGYDFGAMAGGLFVDPEAEPVLDALWREIAEEPRTWEEEVRVRKLRAMERVLPAELSRLDALFRQYLLDAGAIDAEDASASAAAGEALRELLAAFPIYRTYVRPGGWLAGDESPEVAPEDERVVAEALAKAREAGAGGDLLDQLGEALLLRDSIPPPARAAAAQLAARFQQTSGPVMAKGVEDTAFYTWLRFVALNEVGDSPGRFGVSPDALHAFFRERAERWPAAQNAVSTHDSKRSADVRAGLWPLTEVPERWAEAVRRWRERNRRHRTPRPNGPAWPDGPASDAPIEYLLYQTLAGAWPLPVERAREYLEKAAREAKVHTSWTRPDAEYEAALGRFVERVLGDRGFVDDLEAFLAPLADARTIGSLALSALHLTAPGVPDLYQGDELRNLALVDPDNRRPVDFDLRRRLLRRLAEEPAPERVIADGDEGLPKLWLIRQALALRRRRAAAFVPGSAYEPLPVSGTGSAHVFAYARRGGDGSAAVVAVPRLPVRLGLRLAPEASAQSPWGDTSLPLPEGAWRNVLTGEAIEGGAERPLARLLARFPVALLERVGACGEAV